MKICLIGEYSGNLEEGMRKTAFYLSKELSKHHQVLTLDIKKLFFRDFWRKNKDFNPQVIHYIPGPSVISFIIVKMLAFYSKIAKTVISATHPFLPSFSKKIIPLFKPDLILVQSSETEKLFNNLGCETKFLPSGIDVRKLKPSEVKEKRRLREKYGIDKEKFVILHVGPIKEGRGIEIFKNLEAKGYEVIIIGNRSTGIEKQIYQSIIQSGCKVWTKYFEHIEEIYALSDCYLFPTSPENKLNAIEMPLSVLESMSCNLPVITTKFGALPKVFEEGDGLFFVENEREIFMVLEKIKNTNMKVKTREKVLPYSWENIGKRLEKIYSNLIVGEKNEN